MDEDDGQLAQALWNTLRSRNEFDTNGERANVVDGLFAIARAIHRLATVLERRDGDETDE